MVSPARRSRDARYALFAFGALLAAYPLGAQDAKARVTVGPNILVSLDGAVPHIEPMLACHPRDAKVLAAAVTVQQEWGTTIATYASTDGGASWRAATLPLADAGDPQIAIGANGSFYAMGLGSIGAGDVGASNLYTFRSEDSGRTWQAPVFVGRGQDHEQIVIDRTGGARDGRIYVASLYNDYDLGVFRSFDDARSWRAVTRFDSTNARYGQNVSDPLVLSDGTIWAPFTRWTRRRPAAGDADSAFSGYALSTDGGESFTPARIFLVEHAGASRLLGRQQVPEYAVDASAAHRDRIYMVYARRGEGWPRLVLQFSDDRGSSWSPARAIDTSVPDSAEQFQQMVAVNRDGVVGITWFDTRASADRSAFDEYFTASLDGGLTFLPARRVSTASSRPDAAGNLGLLGEVRATRDTAYIRVGASAGRRGIGGDYMGLCASVDGAFHAMWTDARWNVYRLYTAAIRVGAPAAPAPRPATVAVRALAAHEFEVIFEPVAFDSASRVIAIPFRLANRSGRTIYGPLRVRFDVNPKLGDRGAVDVRFYPEILGADNGVAGAGAEFDLTALMGPDGTIEPGGSTATFTLRIRAAPTDPYISQLMTIVTGGMPAPTRSPE